MKRGKWIILKKRKGIYGSERGTEKMSPMTKVIIFFY